MIQKKTIQEYGIDHGNCDIDCTVPDYLFGSEGIIKMMKIQGYWEFNEAMLKNLGVFDLYKVKMGLYGNKQNHATTSALVEFLKNKYPDQIDELKFIYQKAETFLEK